MNRTNKPLTITPGSQSKGNSKTHPYMRNNWQGTPEIQETFERIRRRL